MAEFSEVMRQFDRMCWYYQRKSECPVGCPMNGVNISQCRKVAFEGPEVTEKTVMSWAAGHPVVYPTWAEWLGHKVSGVDADSIYEAWHVLCTTPIPADIAQKLGIEPKEG